MGSNAWFIAYFDDHPKTVLSSHPKLDRDASRKLAERFFPEATLRDDGETSLSRLSPNKRQIFAGSYDGLRIVAHEDLSNDYPSRIKSSWLRPELGSTAYVHATHSSVDWFAYGLWQNGQKVRTLSVSPEDMVLEQTGNPLDFELPYWEGRHPVETDPDEDPYPLPFHPLELAEASLLHHLGFQFEGSVDDWVCNPDDVSICCFSHTRRPFWKFW